MVTTSDFSGCLPENWTPEQMKRLRPDLNDEQAVEVLEAVIAELGEENAICWETANFWADRMFPKREAEVADADPPETAPISTPDEVDEAQLSLLGGERRE